MNTDSTPTDFAIESVQLGERIARYRELRGMSLRSLATASGLSSSFISQLENGHSNASVASLRRIAAALAVTPAQLFDTGEVHTTGVLRATDRPTLPLEGGEKYVLSLPPLKNLEVYAGVFKPGASTGPDSYVHGNSQELFVVTQGSIVLELAGSRYELSKGDSIEFLSSTPHRVINESNDIAEVLWINSPPSPDVEEV